MIPENSHKVKDFYRIFKALMTQTIATKAANKAAFV